MTQLAQRQHHRSVLSNGIVVLVVENPTVDIVATRCFFQGGTRFESLEKAGLVHLTSALLTKGTVNYSSQDIAEQVESIGASLGTEASADYFLISTKTITSDFTEILKLAAEIIRTANFPASELELERRLTLQAIKSQQERPFSIAYEQLQRLMYGNHPYGLSALGYEETVSKITQADLLAYQRQQFRPEQMVVSIAGKIKPADAIAQIEQAFGDWRSDAPLADLPKVEVDFQPQTITTVQDTQQAIVMLGYPAPAVVDKDYAALKLITTYLGSGLSSRLFVELREKRGLAYEVSAFFPTRLEASQFVAYMGTAPQNTETALEGLRSECDRLVQNPLSDEELQTAKSKLLGQYALGKQTNGQIAQVIGWYETLGLGADFDAKFTEMVEAVTTSDLQAVAHQYLAQPAISVVGPAEAIALLEQPS